MSRKDLGNPNERLLFRWRKTIASDLGPVDFPLQLKQGGTKRVKAVYQRAVAQVLATHMNQEGFCFVSVATIATEAGCSERTASYAIHGLGESGWLHIAPGGSPLGGARLVNTYRAAFPSQVLAAIDAPRPPHEVARPPHDVQQATARPAHAESPTTASRAPELDLNKKESLDAFRLGTATSAALPSTADANRPAPGTEDQERSEEPASLIARRILEHRPCLASWLKNVGSFYAVSERDFREELASHWDISDRKLVECFRSYALDEPQTASWKSRSERPGETIDSSR